MPDMIALGVSMNDGTKSLIVEYLDNFSFLVEASEHDNIDDGYWIVKEQENLKKLLNQGGVNSLI